MNSDADRCLANIVQGSLGPAFLYFLQKLHLEIKALPEKDCVVLYQARAGLRIKSLLEAYRGGVVNEGAKTVSEVVLPISRLAVIKSSLLNDMDAVLDISVREYANCTLFEFLCFIDPVFKVYQAESVLRSRFSRDSFKKVFDANDKLGFDLRNYFKSQYDNFDEYFLSLTGGRKEVVIIDSGWRGTAQYLLMRRYPEIKWKGLYFGVLSQADRPKCCNNRMEGLYFDFNSHVWFDPRRAVYYYNHLIESILEPDVPSVSGYVKDGGEVRPMYNERVVGADENILYKAVETYVTEYSSRPIGRVFFAISWFRLARCMLFPSKSIARALCVGSRSADLGMSQRNLVLLEPLDFPDADATGRYRKSLWKPGQLALEYNWLLSVVLQFIFFIKKNREL